MFKLSGTYTYRLGFPHISSTVARIKIEKKKTASDKIINQVQ